MKVYSGEFKKIYDPSAYEKEQWYVNDHTIVKGGDGWHLFGITHTEPASPLDEKNCAHALSESLFGPFEKKPYPIVTDPEYKEAHFWAPHVIFHDGLYYMFWCAGSTEGHDRYRIMVATSKDLWNWQRTDEVNPIIIDGYDARDPMVLRTGGKWVLYYTANSSPEYGNHVVKSVTSDDLLHWGNERTVFTDPSVGTWGGPCESPFVVSENGKYYLFIGPRDDVYNATEVFESDDPFSFSIENKVGFIPSHAAEVVRDEDGKYYVTRAGWGEGGVYIAPLYFDADRS